MKDVTNFLENFELGEAGRLIYEFVWGELCDWYIELAKPRLYNKGNLAERATAQHAGGGIVQADINTESTVITVSDKGPGIADVKQAMTTAQSGGRLIIKSKPGEGTFLKASYLRNHLDRPPLGDVVNTVKVFLVGNPGLHFVMHYKVRQAEFIFDSQSVIKRLGEHIDFSYPEIYS